MRSTTTAKNWPKPGQVWQPCDPAHQDVIVSQTRDKLVYLQYADDLGVSFSMDLQVFMRYYQFSHYDKPNFCCRKYQENIQPFFA